MKSDRKLRLYWIVLLLGVLIGVGIIAGAEEPEVVTLWAGQHIDVGTVTVENCEENIYVTYSLNSATLHDGWGITETHLHIGKTLDGVVNRPGNPMPGRFPYKNTHDFVASYEYVIPLSDGEWEYDDELLIAAHAVVRRGRDASNDIFLYGTQGQYGSNNGLYIVNLDDNSALRLPNSNTGESGWSPNAAAYDAENKRLYYATHVDNAIDGESHLYFYDINTAAIHDAEWSWDGEQGVVVGAGFYNESYYYMPNLTADLWKVTFDADGKVATNELVFSNVNGESEAVYRFGDLAVCQDGIVYLSTNATHGSTAEFFTLDLYSADGDYQLIADASVPDNATGLQLAFGSDGILYGQASSTGEFFEIDKATGTISSVGVTSSAEQDIMRFSDLASGTIAITEFKSETAWGGGERFVERGNWAMYFTYTVCCMEDVGELAFSAPASNILLTSLK